MKRIVWIALGLCTSAFAQQPAPSPDSLYRHLAGNWVMTGNIGRKQTTHDVDAKLVLKNEYVQLHEVAREKDANGVPQYEAIIYIALDKPTGEFRLLWLDNTATWDFASGIGRGKANGNSIPILFGEGTSDMTRNTLTYFPDRDVWTWEIDNLSAGKATPYARLTLTRASAKQQSSSRPSSHR